MVEKHRLILRFARWRVRTAQGVVAACALLAWLGLWREDWIDPLAERLASFVTRGVRTRVE
ncbi:hypothetical protein [Tropicimonas marinistellae]|uniref:hypothetical protein n=1 Tax=Tropicimonas marinistellae TaxID=1739787 RepID=UPI000834F19D|nr:hypothetical protein [Tropicimonas marinistellae]